MKKFFTKKPHTSSESINDMLKVGKELEKNNDILDAYFLYKGLAKGFPSCKACKLHLGLCRLKLQDSGIEVNITKNSTENAEIKLSN